MKRIRRKVPMAAESLPKYGETKVRVAEFKAGLSHFLELVRSGVPVTILNRQHPIARVLPYTDDRESVIVHRATAHWKDLKLPKLAPVEIDPVKLLLEMRRDKI